MSKHRYFFEIAYKGTHFHGWQRQDNAISIQQVVEEKLQTILQQHIAITGSGRTDAGVHCRQQFFHIDTARKLDDHMMFSLNNMLPPDISIKNIREVKEDIHARFSAISRKYEYVISTVKDPFTSETSYLLKRSLDLKTMNEAAALLIGCKDFEAFSKVKTEVNNFICDISEAEWKSVDSRYIFHIRANRFLRGMVRAIVGTLLEVGTDKRSVQDFETVIESKDRKQAGPAAPSQGLFLTEVVYPQSIYL